MTEALLCWRAPLFCTKNARHVARSLVAALRAADLYGHWLLWVPLRAPCRRVIKTVHGLLQTLAGLLIALGTVFALLYKLPSSNRQFWSVHAWSGTGAIALYCLQYPLGARWRARTHTKLAPALYDSTNRLAPVRKAPARSGT